jgi:PKD repeat protein
VGVFGSSNDGVSWSTGNDGPANAQVDELFWVGRSLVAATHGRGVFSINPAIGPAALAAAGDLLADGNGNGRVDPNECSQVYLAVQDIGGTNATNISAMLSTTSPGVTILQGSSTYPNLGSAAVGTNLTPFEIYTSSAFVCGSAVNLNLTVTFDGVTNVLSYSLPTGSSTYTVNQSTGMSIVPGTADSGNHGDEVTTPLSLPFPFVFYGQSFSTVFLNSNGYLELLDNNSYYANFCLPYASFNYAIAPFWTDLRTDNPGEGIFTSISGTAPNRIFNIEWRAEYFSTGLSVNFEVRLYENQSRIDMVYGNLNGNGSVATVGIQRDTGSAWTTFECNAGGLSSGLQVTFAPTCTDGGGVCAALASFTGGPTNGPAPLTVNFTNLSTGATSYSWSFGDSTSSTNVNPSHTYTNAGTYTVSLQAISASATNTLMETNFITVTSSTAPRPLIVSIGPSGTNFVFSFSTVSGHMYTVQYKNRLTDPGWQTLPSIPGTGSLLSVTNGLVGVPERFFRLSVQ